MAKTIDKSKKRRIILLGERRIAWEALKLFRRPDIAAMFDIRVMVTNRPFYDRHVAETTAPPPFFIGNHKRFADEILYAMRREEVDLLLSIQHNWILPPAVLKAVNGQAFNLHNAKLPEYKGYNSISHAILNDDTTFISTVHWMFDAVDSGDVAYVGETPISAYDTAASLYLKTVDAATDAFRKLLGDICDGRPIPRSPIYGDGTFYPRTSLEALRDVTEVHEPGELERRVRAMFFPPANAAYIVGARGRVWVLPDTAFPEIPRHWLAANQLN